MATTRRYRMTISRTTIDKLGIKLYDKVSAVVAELIANAYDADATEVTVTLPLGEWLAKREGGEIVDLGFKIVVEDNGHGIPPGDVNRYYLKVGLDRRTRGMGPLSPKYGRKVLGRKGVGKLAPFGICRQIEILSSGANKDPRGYLSSHFFLDYSKILKDTDQAYYPKVGPMDGQYSKKAGTKVMLSHFERRYIPDAERFHRQLARRFGLPSKNWQITIVDSNGKHEPITVGEFDIDLMEDTKIDLAKWKPIDLAEGTTLKVMGWAAYSKESYRDEEMAGIRIYARGKIVAQTRDFGIQSGFTGEHMARSYLVGAIHADWIDEDAGEDLIRTDRQDILWASERGEALQKWGQELIREIAKRSVEPRRKKARQVFLEKSNLEGYAARRYGDPEIQEAALEVGKVLGGIASLDELEDPEYVAQLRELVLTVAPHKVLVDALHKAGEEATRPLEAVAKVFGHAHIAEFASLGQIAHERVQAIKNLEDQLSPDTPEEVLQSILEKAPWMINPGWTVLGSNETLETLRAAFERWYAREYGEDISTASIQDKGKRPDFVLLNFAGTLEVIEIKRPSHQLNNEEFDRLNRYINALNEFLQQHPKFAAQFHGGVHSTLVCDGLNLKGVHKTAFDGLSNDRKLDHLKWEEFLKSTRQAHEDFLKVARKISRVTGGQ